MISKHFFFMSQAIKKYNSKTGSGEVLASGQSGLFEGFICVSAAIVTSSGCIIYKGTDFSVNVFFLSLLALSAIFYVLFFNATTRRKDALEKAFVQFSSNAQFAYLLAALAFAALLFVSGFLYLMPRAIDIHLHQGKTTISALKDRVSASGLLVG